MPAQVETSSLGCSVMMRIRQGRLAPGTRQGIYPGEHRAAARRIVLAIV